MENGRPDRLDMQIIRQLQEDGRRATKEVARSLGVTEGTVTTRIRALTESGVMRVMAQRNVSMLRDRLPCLVNVWVHGRSIDQVADELVKFERIATVQIAVGSPEIHLTAFVEASSEILALLQNEIGQVQGVDRVEANVALETRTYRSEFAPLDTGFSNWKCASNDLDDRIIHQLQIDGRVSNREISRMLDVPASTVREHVNRLLKTHTIRIGAVCEPRKLGLHVGAFCYLLVSPLHIEAALDYLEGLEDLGQVSSVSGRFTIFVLVGARSYAHLIDIVKSKLEVTPGLSDISVRMISETRKHRPDLINMISRSALRI